jgi:phage-related minor tail protein
MDEPALNVSLALDTEGIRREVASVSTLARGMGTALTGAFRGAIVDGTSLGEVLRNLATRISDLALSAALKPVDNALAGIIQRSIGTAAPTAFARGGVIARPSYFPLGEGLGVAGEQGPEAILPLARGSDGRLGVKSPSASAPHVTVNVTTPDVEGFRRAESQVAAAIARAAARGRRGL